jgi:aminopeptidase-like protein
MNDIQKQPGQEMFDMMRRLWPICRSITGDGVRQTLAILRERLPEMVVHEVPTDTRCFDWVIPKEWAIRDAYIIGPNGRKILDFVDNNLHVINYSAPVDMEIDLDELQAHLHSLPAQPEAVPYVTSYYKENWGFCLAHKVREKLVPGRYRIRIDSEFKVGSLTYGEIFLPGVSDSEVLISTYICHPSMANNELSGPCVTAQLAQWLLERGRRYSYRIVFVPETIGAICYISRHLQQLKEKTIAGYVMTCVGDERAWSFMPSRHGNTLSDRVARHVLKHLAPAYKEYSFLERGSDERQYCSPGVDLPVSSVMRSKYATYPEYHTSLDNMELVTSTGLEQAFVAHQKIIEVIELGCFPRSLVLCEPKMSDRGLRPTIGKVGSGHSSLDMMNLIAYADGIRSLLEIAEVINVPVWELWQMVDKLVSLGVLGIEENKCIR